MKKTFICILVLVFALLSPLFFMENSFVANADTSVVEVDNLSKITTEQKIFNLQKDLSVGETASPFASIGTYSTPFVGTFDGQGHKITIDGAGFAKAQYQGFFGYAVGATIRNVKIDCVDLELNLSEGNDQYIVGILLGYGEDVNIENCEINGTIVNKEGADVKNMTTFGGLAGQLNDGSRVTNCGVYLQVDLQYDLIRESSLVFGGLVGTLADSSKINYSMSYCNFNFTNKSATIKADLNVGGLVGKIMDFNTKIVNSASTMKYALASETIVDDCHEGGVAALISNPAPESGNLKAIAYYMYNIGKDGQVTDYYGNSNDVVYSKSASDYVISVPEGVLKAERFFSQSFSYDGYDIEWEENDWDFDSTWIMANNEVRLQQFQTFTIELAPAIDEKGLLIKTEGNTVKTTFSYGEQAKFIFKFKDSSNSGYYDILDVKKNEESINFGDFEHFEDNDDYRDAQYDWHYSLKKEKVESNIQYTFIVQVSYLTEGTYSFVTSSITYDVYVVANNGGKVKTANVTTQALDARALYKDALPYVVSAIPDYQYAFDYWTLWRATTESDFESHATDTNNYYKHTVNGTSTYWAKTEFTIKDNVDISKRAELSILLGSQDYLNYYFTSPQNFLVKANFKKNTYDFAIKNLDLKKLIKVEVVSHGGLTITSFDASSLDSDKVTLDKNEQISLKIYIRSGFELDESCFQSDLNAVVADKMQVTIDDESTTLYVVKMLTSNFRNFVDSNDKFSVEIKAVEKQNDDNVSISIWIYVAIGGGVLLILALVIVIIVKKKRGGKTKEAGYDYKKYYN